MGALQGGWACIGQILEILGDRIRCAGELGVRKSPHGDFLTPYTPAKRRYSAVNCSCTCVSQVCLTCMPQVCRSLWMEIHLFCGSLLMHHVSFDASRLF